MKNVEEKISNEVHLRNISDTSVPDKNVDFFQVNFKLNAFLKSVTNQYILPFYKQK